MSYEVEYSPEAQKDLNDFNPAQKRQIGIQIEKFALNPLPKNEGGYSSPLGNKGGANLTGLCKIKFKKLGVRVACQLIRADKTMKVVVIAARRAIT